MFEVGFWEIVVILVLVLVVAGPERLPGIVRTLGRWAGRAKALAGQLKSEFEREIDAEELRQVKRDVERSARGLEATVRAEGRAVVEPPPTAARDAEGRDG